MISHTQSWPLLSFSERQQYLAETPDRYSIVRSYYQNQPDPSDSNFAVQLSTAVLHPTQWIIKTYFCSQEEARQFGEEQWLRKLDWMKNIFQNQDPESGLWNYSQSILVCAQFTIADLNFGDQTAFLLSPEDTLRRLQSTLSSRLGWNLFRDPERVLNSAVDCQYWKYHQDTDNRLFCANVDGPKFS